jgi:DeoR/GlpR family transcriptional regulator of sugar metabolism
LAVQTFAKMHADVAVMGAGGITLDGITNSHGLLIEIQEMMIRAAQKVIFCLDHTKFGRKSVSFLCGLENLHVIVTDNAAPQDLVQGLRERGRDVIVAPATQ